MSLSDIATLVKHFHLFFRDELIMVFERPLKDASIKPQVVGGVYGGGPLITRDDVVSQRLKFGSAFLLSSWESKIALL